MVVPDASPPRLDYWLTRKKVADRIRIARRDATYRSDAADRRLHGPRQWAILNLRWAPSAEGGWFDVESQPLHRLDRTAESKKRLQCENFRGRAVEDLRKAWATVSFRAGQAVQKEDGTWEIPGGPHICRHTAATWQMQSGTSPYEAARYLGISGLCLRSTATTIRTSRTRSPRLPEGERRNPIFA